MASIIKTTAISLRKGDSESNRAFTGILGELVADLGADSTGTDINTTLRLHNGVLQGGIPMCRADLLNISTRQLAEGRDRLGMTGERNLAYADLSNLEELTSTTAIDKVLEILDHYGIAFKNLTNTKLTDFGNYNGTDDTTTHAGGLAYKDTSNVNTANLVNATLHNNVPTGNKPLAYADTTNINTGDLADPAKHTGTGSDTDKPLAYADASNIDTSNLEDRLAKIDLSNVTKLSLENAIWGTQTAPSGKVDAERTQNKVTTTDLHGVNSSVKYPSVNAVKNYVGYEIENAGFLRTDYTNSTNYAVLYSNAGNEKAKNSIYNSLYLPDKTDYAHPTGIIAAGTGFDQGKIYLDTDKTIVDPSGTQSDHLKVLITGVNGNGLPTSAVFYQSQGKENIGSGTAQIKNGDNGVINIQYSSASIGEGFYSYTINNITPGTGVTTGEFGVGAIKDLITPIPLTQLLWMSADNVAAGAVTNYSFYPATGTALILSGTKSFSPYPNSGENARVMLKTVSCPTIGGAGLAKTDLSNLLGMSEEDRLEEEYRPWRIRYDEDIPAINVTTIPDNKYETITTQGQVWDVITDAYQKTMGTAAGTEPGGAVTDVATYVKRTLDQYALSDTYRGQVLYYLQNDTNIPTTRPGGAPLQTNDQILLKNKNGVLGERPYLGTWNGSTWTYEPFINQDSQQSNGDYVYCLDLGTWDTENYHNASGNITWNHRTQQLDIAPDHDNVPDDVTIKKDQSTGKISIAPFYVPAPEFFNGNGTTTYFTLNVNNCPNGKVPFDVYVDGVFQYPTIAYTFNTSNRRITFTNGFAPQTGTKNIAVIYRGIIFGTGANAGPINGKHS